MSAVAVEVEPVAGLARISEAERFLGLSRSTLYLLMERGELPYAKIGRNRRIPWDALRELVARNTISERSRCRL